jgi:hypothetical protein
MGIVVASPALHSGDWQLNPDVSDTEPKSPPTGNIPDQRARRTDVTFTAPPAVDAEERLRVAMRRSWAPGDSYLWIGPIPMPLTRSAWTETLRKLFNRPGRRR